MALANPAWLQLDFTLKVFGLRFLAGVFILLACYGFFTRKQYHKHLRAKHGNQHDVHRLQKQLLIQKMQKAGDQELISLLVAYLEKFTTTSWAHSRNSLLNVAGFTDEEIKHLKEVNYGKAKLLHDIKEKIRITVKR